MIPDNPGDPRRAHLLALLDEIHEELDALPMRSGQDHSNCHGAIHSLRAVITVAPIVKEGPAVILVAGLQENVEVQK